MFKKRISGFTLIELLVVIAIIAVLMAILMPALNRVKEQGKLVVCKSNEHQLGLSLYSYASDNHDRIVPGNDINGTGVWSGSNYGYPGPIHLGQLLEGKYLPMPTSLKHAFYCPSYKWSGAIGTDLYYTIGNPQHPSQRSFQYRWGQPWAAIDITYQFRDSMDGGIVGGTVANSTLSLQGAFKGAPTSRIANHAILADFLAWTFTARTHKNQFNVLSGDGSVSVVDDRNKDYAISNDPRLGGFIGWASVYFSDPVAVSRDDEAFDAVDYILSRPQYLSMPKIEGDGQVRANMYFWRN